MPVTKSAIKAMKQNRKARERNKITKADFRGKVKLVKKAAHDGSKELGKLTATAIQAIDKAAKKGVIHKKTAARRKSRLMLSLNKQVGKAVEAKSIKKPIEKPTAKKPATKKSTAKKEAK